MGDTVLHEERIQPAIREFAGTEGAHEEAAMVPRRREPDEPGAVQLGLMKLQGRASRYRELGSGCALAVHGRTFATGQGPHVLHGPSSRSLQGTGEGTGLPRSLREHTN